MKKNTPRLLILVLIILTVVVGAGTIITAILIQNSSSTSTQTASADNPNLSDASCQPYVRSNRLTCSDKDNSQYAENGFIIPYRGCAQPTLSLGKITFKVVDKDSNQEIQGGYSVEGAHNYKAGKCTVDGADCWCYGNACGLAGDAHNKSGPHSLGEQTVGLDCLNSDFTVTVDETNPSSNQFAREYDMSSLGDCSLNTESGAQGATVTGAGTKGIKVNICKDPDNQPNVVVTCKATKIASTPTPTVITPTPTTTQTVTPSQTTTPTSTPTATATPTITTTNTPTVTTTITNTPTVTLPTVTPSIVTPTPTLPATGIVEDTIIIFSVGIGFLVVSVVLYRLKIIENLNGNLGKSSTVKKYERGIEIHVKKKANGKK